MSNEGQEWEKRFNEAGYDGFYCWIEDGLGFVICEGDEDFIDRILADHRDAQQLRERVRVLEEALREVVDEEVCLCRPDSYCSIESARALLSSPVATEGEGA